MAGFGRGLRADLRSSMGAICHDRWDGLIAIGYSIEQPRPRHPDAATDEDRAAPKKALEAAVDEERIVAGRPNWWERDHRCAANLLSPGGRLASCLSTVSSSQGVVAPRSLCSG